ncbi:MAG: type II secretion system F family protein [Spirochaetia bacterium]
MSAFYGDLARLLEAGLTPQEALRLLSREAGDAQTAELCEELAHRAEEGEPLSIALSSAAAAIPVSHRTLVYVGESSGDLEGVLSSLSAFLERDRRALSRAISASVYPAVILGLLLGLSLVFALWVLPSLATVAEVLDPEAGIRIRTHGRVLLAIAAAGSVSASLAVAGAVVWARGARRGTHGGRRLDQGLMSTPVFGTLLRTRRLAQLFFALELLLGRGATAEEAFPVAGETVEGAAWGFECGRIETRLREGERLCEVVSDSPLMPRVAGVRLCIAEAGAPLSGICAELRRYFEQEFDRALETATAAVEPVLIAVAGAAFALFVTMGVLPVLSSYMGLVS